MRQALLLLFMLIPFCADAQEWKLVWSDEFNYSGSPDPEKWSFEHGYVRNHEFQFYQEQNARVDDGVLTITARMENDSLCTSSSINTRGKYSFLYGRLEVRARIPYAKGAWPAIWTLGEKWEWPSCGEIDVMEFYHKNSVPCILANVAHGDDYKHNAVWNSKALPYSHFLEKDKYFTDRFHTWRMDWDEQSIKLYLDDELLNEQPIESTINGKLGNHESPFRHPQYILLNLAVGGDNGGEIDFGAMPMRYEIDYVRVYQKV